MNPVLRDLGRDDRGWRTVLVPARQPGADRSIFVLTVYGKNVQLAQQEEGDMTVFFNPDPNGRTSGRYEAALARPSCLHKAFDRALPLSGHGVRHL